MVVVCAGVFAVGYGRDRGRALCPRRPHHRAGRREHALPGHGRAAAARRASHYDPVLVGLSVVIAVVAATAALWAALNIKSPVAVAVASLVMGGGGEQHALHRHVRGERAGRPLRSRPARGHGDAVHLPPRRRPRVLPLPDLGVRRAVARPRENARPPRSAQRPVESVARQPRTRGRHGTATRPEPLPSEEAMRTPRRTPHRPAPRRRPRPRARPPRPRRTTRRRTPGREPVRSPPAGGPTRARGAVARCAPAPCAPRSSAC